VAREPAFEVAPEDYAFVQKMGKLEWASNERVVLVGQAGSEVASISLPSKESR
jgi:hypothetical protein